MTEPDAPIPLTTRAQISRREALQLFAASMALFKAGCIQRPGEEIRPSVLRPETSPGIPRFFATSMVLEGYATGLLVEAHDGRPTKIEGNPAHPASLGATLAQHQASVLDLYDPHRLRAPRAQGLPSSWNRLRTAIEQLPDGDLWLIVPPDASPSITSTLQRVRARYPQTRVIHHAPIDRTAVYRGSELAFGRPLETQLAFDRAEIVVSLDADLLGSMPNSVRWSRDFAQRRRAVEPGETPVRLFVAEPTITPTGSLADHRLPIRAGAIAALVIALAEALDRRGVATVPLPQTLRTLARTRIPDVRWVELVATALVRHRGASVIIAGERQPAGVHALVDRIALSLGAIGRTTQFTAPVLPAPLGEATITDLIAALHAGQVGTVMALDTDPVFTTPPEHELAALLRNVPLTVHATMHPNATSAACGWMLPLSHYLESWGDARAWDGTASPIQPLIKPLHDTRSRLEVLSLLAGDLNPNDRAIVRMQWRAQFPTDAQWNAVLGEGVMPNTEAPAQNVTAQAADPIVRAMTEALGPADEGIELDLAMSPAVLDGRFANNPWLQELPHPLTKLTWGNAALMSASTALQLGIEDGELVRLRSGANWIDAPALIMPGVADRCVSLDLGYGGANRAAPISHGVGVNAYVLMGTGPIVRTVDIRPTGRTVQLARTQGNFEQHGRELALAIDLDVYRSNPRFAAEHRGPQPTLLDSPRLPAELPQWGMTIDTTICTGCSSCVIACQAENNIPVVGAEGVRRGREMHWLRIDTYIEDTQHGPEVVNQPMLCQHCENAPCEYVCPVYATTHSPDGLNEMTYNRCVGTRFCSNNCPYKVRRFNWFGYDENPTTRALQHNPDVTVRARGVMEKCTYCVQRIRGAEVQARMANRPIAPGEVVTACQQACPTGAIQFGALQHTETPMVQWRQSLRLYGVLHELGTRPRTMYLAKIRNPDPEADE